MNEKGEDFIIGCKGIYFFMFGNIIKREIEKEFFNFLYTTYLYLKESAV